MVKVKKISTARMPRVQYINNQPVSEAPESSLLTMRLKELDKEFLRQTKRLAEVTRKLKRKWS